MRKWMLRKRPALSSLTRLALMLMLLPMSGCVTLGNATSWLDTSCSAFRPITYSSHDTPETVKEVRAHNRVYDALCPVKAS